MKIIQYKNKILFNLFAIKLFLFASTGFSQNHIYVGIKSYNATSEWSFSPAKRTFSDDEILVQIGKSTNEGFLMLSVASEYGRASITGAILVYLKNGKVIQLFKKVASDYANDKISVIYTINSNHLREMRISNIVDIRFTYISPFKERMGLNARNGQAYNNGMQVIKDIEIETAVEIENLYNQ